jgi:mannose-6-phosphate isomerase-like protein (cupin superfamily)
MSDFTHVNFRDAPNSAAGSQVEEFLEFRQARKVIDSEHLGVSRFTVQPNYRPPFGHKHQVQEEVYVVTAGSGRFKIGDEIVDVEQGDVLRVAPTVMRAFESGPDGLELVVVGSDRPEEGDGDMTPGWWND